MLIEKRKIQGAALLLVSFMVIATGCTNAARNQVKQQAVQPGTTATTGTTGTTGSNSNQYHPYATTTGDNRVQVADQAAAKITQLNGIKSANVLVTRRNAYVAAVINTGQGDISQGLKDQISQQVKSTDPNIQNVYVSTNPEFVNRVRTYVTDVGQGRPVSGFFEQFSEMVQRIFPTAK
ncbi:YhcN/YlaJ family sporulation lipoprotein [Paenibacillus sp. GCM10027628]|uniref:YhcN/YlaJ family sporulation lipoprotein n=1 Tax=Paenibacillus sp. GCM10027628 TaxID=3273413 RepID=UPI00363D9B11